MKRYKGGLTVLHLYCQGTSIHKHCYPNTSTILQLYTTSGQEAFEWFSQTPSLFHVYHKGFTTQVERWPINPVE